MVSHKKSIVSKKSKILFFIILSLTAIHFGKLMFDMGLNRRIEPNNLSCQKIKNLHGPEDITKVDQTLFVSSTYLPPQHQFEKGDIYAIDLNDPQLKAKSLVQDFNLSPHGIYAKKFPSKIRLWAINHAQSPDRVEVFDYIDNTLKHIDSIQSPLYIRSNDIVAIDETRFFLGHDHGSQNKFKKAFENYSRIGQGYVTFYDGKSVKKVIGGLDYTNGMEFIDGKLYVAQMLNKTIDVYQFKNDKEKEVEFLKSYEVPYPPDNISMEGKHNLIIGTHPNMFATMAHTMDKEKAAPSAVLNLDLKTGKSEVLYANDGKELSGSSVGVLHNDDLFIGNIYLNFVLKCKLLK